MWEQAAGRKGGGASAPELHTDWSGKFFRMNDPSDLHSLKMSEDKKAHSHSVSHRAAAEGEEVTSSCSVVHFTPRVVSVCLSVVTRGTDFCLRRRSLLSPSGVNQ